MDNCIMIFNHTHHEFHLKLKHHKGSRRIEGRCDYSWSLPFDPNHKVQYKLKKDGKTIAYIWLRRNGLISNVENTDKHFCVTFQTRHFRHGNQHMQSIRGYGRYGPDIGDWPNERCDAVLDAGQPQMIFIRKN